MNSIVNKTALDITSLTVLGLQLPASISYIILGSLGVFGNSLLFYVIIGNRNLRSSNFYLKLFHIAVADTLFCLFSLMIGLSRLIHLALSIPETNSQVNCACLIAPWFVFKNASPAQAFCIGLDRLLCVAFPVRYKNAKVVYNQLINVALWIICVGAMSYASSLYTTVPLVPTCTTGQIYKLEYNAVSSGLGITMDLATICCYGGLLVVLIFRLEKGKRQGQNMKELKKSLQFRAVLTSFMLLGVYTFVCLSGEIHHLITAAFDPVTKSKLQPYSVTIMLIGCDLSSVICVWRNHDIREAIGRLLCCGSGKGFGSTRVSPMSLTHPSVNQSEKL